MIFNSTDKIYLKQLQSDEEMNVKTIIYFLYFEKINFF